MLYRCLNCDHEIDFGFWPSSGTHTVFMYYFLLCLFLAGWLAYHFYDLTAGLLSHYVELPKWAMIFGLVFAIFLLVGLVKLPEFIEYRLVCRKPCPACGNSRWSWGFGRGMGL